MKRTCKNMVRGAGFTLVELLIVIVILGVLAAVAIPAYTKYVRSAHSSAAVAGIQGVKTRQEAYFAEFSRYVNCQWNPAALPGGTKAAWNNALPDWQDLGFALTAPTYYQFMITSSNGVRPVPAAAGAGSGGLTPGVPWYIVTARGDLDADGVTATFIGNSALDTLVKTNPNE